MKLIAAALFCLVFTVKAVAQEETDTCTFLTTVNNPAALLYEKPKISPDHEIRLMNMNEPVYVLGKTGKFAIVLEGFAYKYLLLENTQLTKPQIALLTPTNLDEKILQIDNTFTTLFLSVEKQKDSLIARGKLLYNLAKYGVGIDDFFMLTGAKTKGCTLRITLPEKNSVKGVAVEIDGVNSINDAEATKTVACANFDAAGRGAFTFADLFNDKSNVIDHLSIKEVTVQFNDNSKKQFSGSDLKKIVFPSPTATVRPEQPPQN